MEHAPLPNPQSTETVALREKRLAISPLYGLRGPLLVNHCTPPLCGRLTGMQERPCAPLCLPRKEMGLQGWLGLGPRGGLTPLSLWPDI